MDTATETAGSEDRINADNQIREWFHPVHRDIFRQAASSDAVLEDKDPVAMRADFVIVTNKGPNRHGVKLDILPSRKGGGLLTANYEKNPVCYFEHGMHDWPLNLPIGSARNPESGELSLKLAKTKASGSVYFAKSEAAEAVFRLYDEGVLRAASIMAYPTRATIERLEEDAEKDESEGPVRRLLHVYEADLAEFGPVGIGADPDAVRSAAERPWVMKVDGLPALLRSYAGAEPAQPLIDELKAMKADLTAIYQENRQKLLELQQSVKQLGEAQAARDVPAQRLDPALEKSVASLRASIADIRSRLGLAKGGRNHGR